MRILILLCAVLLCNPLDAQPLTKLWTGLRTPQPETELPKGNAPFPSPRRTPKRNVPARLQPVHEGEWIMAGGWEMTDGDTWYNATVPGTVLTTLVAEGVYPDPYFGLNNLSVPDTLCRMDWWYRTTFEIPRHTPDDRIRLLLNGINYKAEVFLNGKKLGNIHGAFIRGHFDITDMARRTEKNILTVHILPPNNPGIPHEQSMAAGQGLNGGALSLDGPTFISSVGWDWMPGIRDRNIGIWQDVRLQIGGQVVIGDPLVVTDVLLPDTTKADITIKTTVRNCSGQAVEGVLTAETERLNLRQPYRLNAREEKELVFSPADYPELHLDNPRLWWPNGYGNPELYRLTLKAETGNTVSDVKHVTFGIREMSYELMVHDAAGQGNIRVAYTPNHTQQPGKPLFDYENIVPHTPGNNLPTLFDAADRSGLEELPADDPMGPYLVLRVNGRRIFCHGGNWGMDDAMKRVSRERLEPYFKLHRQAHFNIIRNWTGESTEELFYTLCDEYGMLVWNDFWITTDDTVEPGDMPLFMRNATDVVRRYRNHPSIAVWCPRNEGFAPHELAYRLNAMIAREDPTRHYHGQSRYLNMDTSGPWGYFKDPSKYYTHHANGFITEIGSFAIPTAHTLRKFIAPEDQWPINDVWAYHDLHHTSQNFEDFMAAVERYGKPTGMEDFSDKAQLVCYDAWRDMIEAWNSRMWNNTSGQILWMSHPAWPSMIWQTYTYDYETPGSYFGAKKACEPLHIQRNLPDNRVTVVNTTLHDHRSMQASVRHIDLQGKELYRTSVKTDVKANSATSLLQGLAGRHPEAPAAPPVYLMRLELSDRKGNPVSVNDYWIVRDGGQDYRQISALPQTRVNITAKAQKGKIQVTVGNPTNTIAIALKLNVIDKHTGEIILPAYFSEGYFNLLPHEKRTVTLELPAHPAMDYDIAATGYNLPNTLKR